MLDHLLLINDKNLMNYCSMFIPNSFREGKRNHFVLPQMRALVDSQQGHEIYTEFRLTNIHYGKLIPSTLQKDLSYDFL